jgi:hypothetical protein
MPYQVKAGSLTIVAINSAEALRVFEALSTASDERVSIRDMDGLEIDPERIRSVSQAVE